MVLKWSRLRWWMMTTVTVTTVLMNQVKLVVGCRLVDCLLSFHSSYNVFIFYYMLWTMIFSFFSACLLFNLPQQGNKTIVLLFLPSIFPSFQINFTLLCYSSHKYGDDWLHRWELNEENFNGNIYKCDSRHNSYTSNFQLHLSSSSFHLIVRRDRQICGLIFTMGVLTLIHSISVSDYLIRMTLKWARMWLDFELRRQQLLHCLKNMENAGSRCNIRFSFKCLSTWTHRCATWRCSQFLRRRWERRHRSAVAYQPQCQ